MQNKPRQKRSTGYSTSFHKATGLWEWSVLVGYNEIGKPVRARGYASTKTEAASKAQEVATSKRKGGFVATGKDTSVGEFLDYWIESRIKPYREPKTTSFYEANIRCHLKPAFGKVPLRKLTVQHVQRLIAEKTASELSPSTVHGMLRTLRSALEIGWKEELIEQNVAKKVTMPKLEQKDPEFLRPEDARKLLDASKGHFLENLLSFALATGVRVGEATGLTWSNVNFSRREATVVQQLQRIEGKLQLKVLKTKASRRTLAITGIALNALRDEQSRQMILRSEMGSDFNELDLVFLNAEARPLDPKNIDTHLRSLCRKAGIQVISFHKLRHTAATLMVAAGVELHQVKEQLGHSQIALTANLYAHGVSESSRKAASKLDQILQSGEIPE